MIRLGFRLAFGLDFALSLAFTQILIILASHGLSELSRRSQEVLNGFLGRSWQVPRSSKKLRKVIEVSYACMILSLFVALILSAFF